MVSLDDKNLLLIKAKSYEVYSMATVCLFFSNGTNDFPSE